jgi:hypothetical protein
MVIKSGITRLLLAFAAIALVPGSIVLSIIYFTIRGIRKLRRTD